LDRIDVHVVAYQIAPSQHGMVTIMIPQIRFSDRPLTLAEFFNPSSMNIMLKSKRCFVFLFYSSFSWCKYFYLQRDSSQW